MRNSRRLILGMAILFGASLPATAAAGPMTGVGAGMMHTDLFHGLRGGLTLHGGLVADTRGFDGLVGGGLGLVVFDEDKSDLRPLLHGERRSTRWSPRMAFGLESGYLPHERAGETRAYLTGLGTGPFTFGGGAGMLLLQPASRLLLGMEIGPEIDAHVPIGDHGPVFQFFLRADFVLVNRDLFPDSMKLGARLLIDFF